MSKRRAPSEPSYAPLLRHLRERLREEPELVWDEAKFERSRQECARAWRTLAEHTFRADLTSPTHGQTWGGTETRA